MKFRKPPQRRLFLSCVLCLAALLPPAISSAEEAPPLPAGLEDDGADQRQEENGEPALPAGLGGEERTGAGDEAPALPSGLEPAVSPPSAASGDEGESGRTPWRERLPFDLSGFWETRAGVRTQGDPYEKTWSLGESRLQLQAEKGWDRAAARVTADFLYDPVLDKHAVDLDRGQGWIDLREAYLLLRPARFLDLKCGRQILTWGTGDMLFVNDLFPKDWNSFFIGRDDEYLKSPSDALKVSLFGRVCNLDLVYTPCLDPDRFIDGRRISYYNGLLGRRAGRDAVVRPLRPAEWFQDDEWALRLYRNVRGYEFALYAHDGYWKSPRGMDPATMRPCFPRLSVYGASARGQLLGGIANAEVGYYDSRRDREGSDPFTPNSQLRLLLGFEKEVAKDFTVGVQYYVEWRMEQGAYQRTLFPGTPEGDEIRQVLTLRLTKLLLEQNLTLSCFTYYSPTDRDIYLRPKVGYKLNDHWTVEAGANVFCGADRHTFFGQFEKNSNVYLSLRFGF